ncbi:hypothetical protein [Kibdelosporangium phytohabitans]|uniref:GLTT repeat-containing protein n=1 Tax=Kibdelosporangium phytohabitans TaxID=860235 RepID=A0A0N9I838_9PSEU|nr:hypothetical protein [Kibdelosporangium phytohabitans]ALG14398.1 hypothetical protein AOZ06_52745 [Kibdelosporangium phytohabitans]MBE1466564.1 hypothetical protein [Kibdelosporangium phytohabitans]
MRKTIRRGVLITATAACALGFGLTQASATTVPALPTVPQLPVTSLTDIGQKLGQNLGDSLIAPSSMPLPALPGEERALPTDMLANGSLLPTNGLPATGLPTDALATDALAIGQLGELTPLGGLTELANLGGLTDATQAIAPTNLGTPALSPTDLPLNVRQSPLPATPQLPSVDKLLDTPLTVLPVKDGKLPVELGIEHNDLPSHLIPDTSGVSVQGVPTGPLQDVTAVTDSVALPGTPVSAPGMQSISLPRELPLDVPTSTIPSLKQLTSGGLTGAVQAPAGLPQLPTGLTSLPLA